MYFFTYFIWNNFLDIKLASLPIITGMRGTTRESLAKSLEEMVIRAAIETDCQEKVPSFNSLNDSYIYCWRSQ